MHHEINKNLVRCQASQPKVAFGPNLGAKLFDVIILVGP
jgi:hypothetical protein